MSQPPLIDGRYQLLKLLGEGGVAEVWLAEDRILERRVAIKLLRRQYAKDQQLLVRFRREAQLVARLDSPHIVQVFGVSTGSGPSYIVMEYVEGQDLQETLRYEAPLPVNRALTLLRDVAEGVAAAHAEGMIHRDLKPGNILISSNGEVKVTDFGIARDIAGAGLTEPGTVWGTSHYLAPEQATGKTLSTATDVYALGVLLFEMLTGRLPFPGDDPVAVALAHVREPVPDIQAIAPTVPSGIAQLIRRMMDKAPERRPRDASVLVEILESYLDDVSQATMLRGIVDLPGNEPATELPAGDTTTRERKGNLPPRPPRPLRLRPRPRRAVWPLIGLVLIGAIATMAVLAWQGRAESGAEEGTSASPPASEEALPPLPTFTPEPGTSGGHPVPGDASATLAPEPSPSPAPTSSPTSTATPTSTPETVPGPLRAGNGPDARAVHLRGQATIHLDGNLNEWISAPVPINNVVLAPERWRGPDDLSGNARFAWDPDFLYLAVERIDNEHYHPDVLRGGDLYRGDSVELWLDVDLAGDFDIAGANEGELQDDYQFAFSAGNFQSTGPEGFIYYPERNEEWIRQVRVRAEPIANGYTMEVAIPWTVLGIRPRPNLVLGYAVLLNDSDAPHTGDPLAQEPQVQLSTSREAPYLKPLTFGNLILSPQ